MKIYEIDTEIRAKALSRYLFQLMFPEGKEPGGEFLFNWESRNGKTVIYVDPDMVVPIFVKSDFDEVVFTLGEILNGYITPEKGGELKEYIQSNDSVLLSDLIPDNMIERDLDWVYDNGIRNRNNTAV